MLFASLCVCVYVYVYMCVCVCVRVCVYVYMYRCVCVFVGTHSTSRSTLTPLSVCFTLICPDSLAFVPSLYLFSFFLSSLFLFLFYSPSPPLYQRLSLPRFSRATARMHLYLCD